MAKVTAIEKITKVATKLPKKGLTANQIAEKAGVGYTTTLAVIGQLLDTGTVQVVGYVKTGKAGKPPTLYGTS